MSTDATQPTPKNPHNPPATSTPPKPAPRPQDVEPRLKELTEMVAALRARRQASLGRWNEPR